MRASPKPVATTTAIMVLVDRGKIDFDEKVSHYLPAFAARGKSAITIRQLLVHVSGLPAETPVADYALGRPQVQKRIAALEPKVAAGTKLIYSDVGYLVLEEIIRKVTGQALATFAAEAIFCWAEPASASCVFSSAAKSSPSSPPRAMAR